MSDKVIRLTGHDLALEAAAEEFSFHWRGTLDEAR
jgi:hypothetical protein